MSNAIQFQLETTGKTATLYLSEEVPLEHLGALCEACATLPPEVRMLRLDLHGVHRLDVEMMSTLRALMREWRVMRGGECRLSFRTENLMLTYTERASAPVSPRTSWALATASDAMTAAYL